MLHCVHKNDLLWEWVSIQKKMDVNFLNFNYKIYLYILK